MLCYLGKSNIKLYGDTAFACEYICHCGKKFINRKYAINSGHVRSCGCQVAKVARERMTGRSHNMSKTKPYRLWYEMIKRCGDKNHMAYKWYGGRGITVCDRWLKFENFLEDMGERPAGRSLDRVDNSKGYSKENCRWATAKEQQRNRRNNRVITVNGQDKCVSEWGEILSMSGKNIRKLYEKSDEEMALCIKEAIPERIKGLFEEL